MENKAIYSVTEHKKTDYLYGQGAAAYSLPFFFLQCIERGKDDPDAHLSVAHKMTGLEQGPDCVVDFMEAAQAKATLGSFGAQADIAMRVEIDMDAGVVRFEHNPLCYHLPPEDFSVSIEDGLRLYTEAQQDIQNGLWRFQDSVEQRLAGLLTEIGAPAGRREAPEQGAEPESSEVKKTVLSVTERGETRWFESERTGTRCGALAALAGIKALRSDGPSPIPSAGDCLSGLHYSYKYGGGLSDEDGLVAREISHETAARLSKPGGVPLWISLDFDNEALTFRRFPPGAREDVSVSFSNAETCMEWAVADLYDELGAVSFLENALEGYLENYVPRQEPGMGMSL